MYSKQKSELWALWFVCFLETNIKILISRRRLPLLIYADEYNQPLQPFGTRHFCPGISQLVLLPCSCVSVARVKL